MPCIISKLPKAAIFLFITSIITPYSWAEPNVILPVTVAVPVSTPPPPLDLSAKERFGDLPNFALETPEFINSPHNNNQKDFTTEAELTAFIYRKIAPSPHADWLRIGKTSGGRDLHLIIFTQDGRSDPLSMAASRKPNIWIIAQQHGNEPAGAEAALEFMRRLVHTELRHVLERVNVIVMPRANPDGAANNQRETNAKGDMNRDHLHLGLLETQRLHARLNDYPPSVVIDAHEFMPTGSWLERYGVAEASDILVQSASHPGVADSLKRIAREVFDPALTTAWQLYGLKSFMYHTLNSNSNNLNNNNNNSNTPHSFVQMGSNTAGVGRNTMGLKGAVSYLIESRGIGLGKENYPRRVASHVISMVAIVRASAAHADALRSAQREARKSISPNTEWVIDHTSAHEIKSIPMLDITSNADKTITVNFQNNLIITPTISRSVPLGYIVPTNNVTAALIGKLRALGLVLYRSTYAQELEMESYTINQIKPETNDFDTTINHLSTETQRFKKVIEAGSLWIPMIQTQQPQWRIAAALLEPEGVGSLLSYKSLFHGNTEFTVGQTLPLFRVVGSAGIIAPQLEDKD